MPQKLGHTHLSPQTPYHGAAPERRWSVQAGPKATAVKPVLQPPSRQPSGQAQRESIWQQIKSTEYKKLPDCPQRAPKVGGAWPWLYSRAHAVPALIGSHVADLCEVPLRCGAGGLSLGHNMLAAAWAMGVGAAFIPLCAAYRAAKDLHTLVQQPRAVTAKVSWRTTQDNTYRGLFKGGAPGLLTIAVDRLGPSIRWETFVDGQKPVALNSHDTWGKDVAAHLAHVNPNGTVARGNAPKQVSLEVAHFRSRRTADWRKEFINDAKPGLALYEVHVTDAKSKESRVIGELVLESEFVASAWGDEHLAAWQP